MDLKDPSFRAALDAHLDRYAGGDDGRAVRELLETVAVYALALWALPVAFEASRSASSWPAALTFGAVTAVAFFGLAGAQVRAFMVHHDLTHGSFFSSRKWNRALAPIVGALVSTSPSVWQREHDRHHRDSNNLDKSQDGQTASWTVAQYEAAPAWQRWAYWLVNQRPVLFGLAPPLYFLGFMRVRARWYENAVFGLFVALLWWTERLGAFAAVILPSTIFGFLVFHAQHTFDGVVKRRGAAYDFVENGLVGSSLLVVPRWPVVGRFLDWCLFSVEYHHVHHLRPGLAAWKLKRCHEEGGALFDVTPRVTLGAALSTTRYTLYDEAAAKLVTFAGHAPWRAAGTLQKNV
ncbi:MAG: fatty acid desaturase [Myxococcota bacterium]